MNRRRFLKYAGATALVAGASAVGYEYFLKPPSSSSQTKVTQTSSATSKFNFPPNAYFTCKPKYLNPTDQQTVQFTNLSTDLDGDPLTYRWLVDNQPVSTDKDYSTQLPIGQHEVDLEVSDPFARSVAAQTVTVEPDQIYPTKPLHVKFKGTNYFVGDIMPEGPKVFPTEDEMTEQLYTIHQDLGCNAIIVAGGANWEDKMIDCGKIALNEGFDRVYVQPRYVNYSPDDTVAKIGEFASKVKTLREVSDRIVYSVGHEFGLETLIITGDGYFERFGNFMQGRDLNKVAKVLPQMFKEITDTCRKNYGSPVMYAANAWEAFNDVVPWGDPMFESIGVSTYIVDQNGTDEKWWLQRLDELRTFGKPVQSTDWGMHSFEGADQYGGWSPLYYSDQTPYDEEPQVRYISRTLDMLNSAKIDGCYWVEYNDPVAKGLGLFNPDTRRRKKGFYMYKSYQRTS